MTGRNSSTRIRPPAPGDRPWLPPIGPPAHARLMHCPRRLGDPAAGSRAWKRQRPAGGVVGRGPAGVGRGRIGAAASSHGAAKGEKTSLQAGMSFRIIGLRECIAAILLEPESAYFSIGFGNIHPTPELGSSNTWAMGSIGAWVGRLAESSRCVWPLRKPMSRSVMEEIENRRARHSR